MSDDNDLIYGLHPVTEALRNPKRKVVSLMASKNAADRLAEECLRDFPHAADFAARHERSALRQPRDAAAAILRLARDAALQGGQRCRA